MVDFRYHLVSIIAVFLALAVGLVLGSTALQAGLVNGLESRVNAVTRDRDALRVDKDKLSTSLTQQMKFGKAVLPYAVAGRLANERIVIVSAPRSPAGVRDAAISALTAAGATIAGRVQLTDKLIDPAQVTGLDTVAQQAVGGPSTGQGTPLQRAANQLAIALSTPSRVAEVSTGPNAETERILGLFHDGGFVTVDGESPARSSIVVVVAPGPEDATEPGREDRVRAVNEIIGALSRQAAAVVTVTPTGGATDGGVLASLRRDGNLATHVSSVDQADTPAGQTALVFAVVERLHAAAATGTKPPAGHYGDGPGADKPLPDPAELS